MIEMVVKDLNGTQVATVTQKTKNAYTINTENESVRQNIQEAMNRAVKTGIPLRFDRQQKTSEGVKYQRLGRWLKPQNEEFLQALADYLVRYNYYAYTLETSPA